MILDQTLTFADGLDVSGAVGVANIGDQINVAISNYDMLDTLYLVVQVETAFASGGAATVEFQLVSADTPVIPTDGTQNVHWKSQADGFAELTAGKAHIVPLPGGSINEFGQYVGLAVNTLGAATTAGTVNAFLTMDPQRYRAFPEAQN